MSNLTIVPLSTALGAQISGVDVSQPLNLEQRDAIEQALLKHQVLFFRDQPITPQQQARFAAYFGDLHIHPIYPNVPEQPEVLILDTDVTFLPTPAMGAVLSAKLLPEFGGDTLWASGIAAYEALSAPMKRLLEGLTATHDFTRSFPLERYGNTPEALAQWEEARRKNPPLSHPVIRTHPVSGRRSLFVNEGFTAKINELSETESEAVLKFLFAHTTRPEFTVRWRWQKDDIAFWDNRVTQHYAVDDYRPARRVMQRATVLGDAPFFR
jgi:taurine dioxygenase